MKKRNILLFSLLSLFYQAGFCQQKGQWQIGSYMTGRLRTIYANTSQEAQDKAIVLYPNIGVWVSNSTQIGISVPIGFEKRIYNYPSVVIDTIRVSRSGVGIYVRQEFLTTKIRPFALVQLSYNQVKTKWHQTNSETGNYSVFKPELQLGAGATYLISNRMSIVFMVSYNPLIASYFDSKLRTNFGIHYSFPKRNR